MSLITNEIGSGNLHEPNSLLEEIVNASTSLLEEQEEERKKMILERNEDEEDEEAFHDENSEDEEDEEFFEDGDEEDDDEEEEGTNENVTGHKVGDDDVNSRHESLASVLTELSQATSLPLPLRSISSGNLSETPVIPQATRPYLISQPPSAPRSTSTASPQMTATINSINALLQSHLNSASLSSNMSSHKVRLSGPIRANVNIRHGVWAPRLRCRKRKNLHAKDGIWIHPACTLDHLVHLVKSVLPNEFEWDAQTSPLRYQAVNDQSLQSLKTVSGTVATGQSLYSAFDLVRNRRSDGDNFILQLYVYGTWTVLLKPHMNSGSNSLEDDVSSSHHHNYPGSNTLQPPPKKKYQQAHYNQLQMSLQAEEDGSSNNPMSSSMFSHMRINPASNNSNAMAPTTSLSSVSSSSSNNSLATNSGYTHPLAANPPVTFLPTVTLEMKLNGTFVPVEVSRRSFIAAIRACSVPKVVNPPGTLSTNPTNLMDKDQKLAHNNSGNNNNMTPPPSEI